MIWARIDSYTSLNVHISDHEVFYYCDNYVEEPSHTQNYEASALKKQEESWVGGGDWWQWCLVNMSYDLLDSLRLTVRLLTHVVISKTSQQ